MQITCHNLKTDNTKIHSWQCSRLIIPSFLLNWDKGASLRILLLKIYFCHCCLDESCYQFGRVVRSIWPLSQYLLTKKQSEIVAKNRGEIQSLPGNYERIAIIGIFIPWFLSIQTCRQCKQYQNYDSPIHNLFIINNQKCLRWSRPYC